MTMGLTEDKINGKVRRLSKEMENIYEQVKPKPSDGLWKEVDKLEASLMFRLGMRPITSVEIDMAVIDFKKEFSKVCWRGAK